MSQSTPTDHEIDVYAGEFVLTGDKSKSWKITFPKSKANPAATSVAANRFHNDTKVLLRIGEKRTEIALNDEKEFDLSVSQLKEKLSRIIDMGMQADANGKLQGLGASVSAVSEVNRMNGNHAAQRISANVSSMTHEEWLASLE